MQEAAAPRLPHAGRVTGAPVPAAKEDSGWMLWLLVVIIIAVVVCTDAQTQHPENLRVRAPSEEASAVVIAVSSVRSKPADHRTVGLPFPQSPLCGQYRRRHSAGTSKIAVVGCLRSYGFQPSSPAARGVPVRANASHESCTVAASALADGPSPQNFATPSLSACVANTNAMSMA
jgi:hypothetical protein